MSYKRLTNEKSTSENTKIVYNENGFAIFDKELVEKLLEEHNRLWELENKIENGTLIELPCKAGDMVYIPYKFRNKNGVLETIIEEIRIEEKHILFWAKPLYTNNSVRVKYLGWKKYKDYNKNWFLTKAEAEKKLKELSKNPWQNIIDSL